MIALKQLNPFKTMDLKRNTNIKLSKCKSILKTKKGEKEHKNKRVKFQIPGELRIMTPNSNSMKDKNFFNLNMADRKSQTQSKFFNPKNIIIKPSENNKKNKRTKSRFNLSPMNKYQNKESQNFVRYIRNYPKTFYQKISDNIEKMRIKEDRTIKIMRKNLSLTNREVFLQSTKVLDINTLIKKGLKLKKESLMKTEIKENTLNTEKEKTDENVIKKENTQDLDIRPSKPKNNKSEEKNIIKRKYLRLSKLPSKPFYKMKTKPFYIPLFQGIEGNKNFYKNMCHIRFSDIKDINSSEVSKKIYDTPYMLKILNTYIKQPEVQLKNIYNKLMLLLNNLHYFYNNLLMKNELRHAFINMENPIKAQFNSIIEEECILIIKLIPLLLKEFYFSLSQLLFVSIPELKEEMEKNPSNEIQCLKYNIYFFNKVKEYYEGCVEIYNIIQKQIAEFKFSPSEFHALNNIIDLARYNSTTMISMAKSYIEKTKIDDELFNNFKIALGVKKKQVHEEEIGFERFHKRRKKKILNDTEKIDRIKSSLNIGTKEINGKFILNLNKKDQTSSILNSYLIKDMMKYFTPTIKKQIISQQIIERYKNSEIERLKFDPSNSIIDDGDSVQIEEKDSESQQKKQKENIEPYKKD